VVNQSIAECPAFQAISKSKPLFIFVENEKLLHSKQISVQSFTRNIILAHNL
jgi:hypothetical protein